MLRIANDRYPWINHEFFKEILRSSESLHTSVIGFELYDAVGVGENYTSHLIRATVKYNDGGKLRQKSFVIKTSLGNDLHDVFDKIAMFDKEIAFYRDMVPKFEKFTKLIDPDFKCSPICYAVNKSPMYFVFEDLKVDGYRNMDRHIGLNFEATEMLVKKLARFHAIGAMVYAENPQYFEHHIKNLIRPETRNVMLSFTSGVRSMKTICKNWPGFEVHGQKLEKLLEVVLERASTSFIPDPNTFNTLTHGDLWVNNIMYKFDESRHPIDVLMVDYQIGCYGSPAIDLTYLFYTSTTNDTFEMDWDRLIQIYHGELVKSLRAVDYPKSIPSLTELHTQFLNKSMYSVMVALVVLGPRHIDNFKLRKAEQILMNPSKKPVNYDLYAIPEVMERVQYLLDYFNRKGLLDV